MPGAPSSDALVPSSYLFRSQDVWRVQRRGRVHFAGRRGRGPSGRRVAAVVDASSSTDEMRSREEKRSY